MERFKNGDVVCFIGDSIMAANNYIPRIMDYYYKNFTEENITFYNCGISGSTAKVQCGLFNKNVAPHKPTHCFITTGVNDSARYLLDEPKTSERYNKLVSAFENYKENLAKLCDLCESIGAKVILGTPYPFAEYQSGEDSGNYEGGYALILGYANYVKEFAAQRNYELCDYHSYMTRAMQTEDLYNPDRVHPNDKGHYYIAKCFLENQGFAPSDQYAPVPEYFSDWCDNVNKLFLLCHIEDAVVKDFSLSDSQKLAAVKEFVENKGYLQMGQYTEHFRIVTGIYLENKPKEQELISNIQRITGELKGRACK